jgi:hypothetical protein
MALNLYEVDTYANPYETNRDYLSNMAILQMKALNEMRLNGRFISNGLWAIPEARVNKKDAKESVESFIDDLNNELMRL